ncbi:hypothetical protein BCR34DRAFT_614509 [Clohesyomyces aquaticus]|uniref:Uncharacterized protein n=1 Tax=Clohesyomyces aquaticus TaxID=1231657 RepID=A0A1Y1ZN66_9PLEO|nr:hypothetical protein BCR34DRAFT_614509 [Clohesyomyces aquaticus]
MSSGTKLFTPLEQMAVPAIIRDMNGNPLPPPGDAHPLFRRTALGKLFIDEQSNQPQSKPYTPREQMIVLATILDMNGNPLPQPGGEQPLFRRTASGKLFIDEQSGQELGWSHIEVSEENIWARVSSNDDASSGGMLRFKKSKVRLEEVAGEVLPDYEGESDDEAETIQLTGEAKTIRSPDYEGETDNEIATIQNSPSVNLHETWPVVHVPARKDVVLDQHHSSAARVRSQYIVLDGDDEGEDRPSAAQFHHIKDLFILGDIGPRSTDTVQTQSMMHNESGSDLRKDGGIA